MTWGRRIVQCHDLVGASHLAARAGTLALVAHALLAVGCGGTPASVSGAMGGRGGHSGGGGVKGAAGFTGAGDATGAGDLSGTGGVFPDAAPMPSTGSFSWSTNGQTFATVGYYNANTNGSGGGTLLVAADFALTQIPCTLWGNFASPFPPAGTYPIGDEQQPLETGTFVGICSNTTQQTFVNGDQSVGGQVTLTKSAPGDIEGSFTMTTIPPSVGSFTLTTGPDGGQTGAKTYTGEFAVTGSDFPTR